MGSLQVGIAFLVGAAGLALWFDVRLGDRAPQSVLRLVLHAAAAALAVRLVAAFAPQLIDPASHARTAATLCLLVLPGWMYAFLVSIWALKLIRSVLPR